MCTETFLRLPEEKRTRFLNAAWEEFTSCRFADVSVNKIVRRAEIPRGSFYQYFTGKDDLLAFLLEDVRNYIRGEYRRILKENGGDIFQAQLDCFDQLAQEDHITNPMILRCVKFLKCNQGLDIQKLLPTRPGQRLLDGLWDVLDLSPLRRPDQEYGRVVFSLLMAALGQACMDALLCPKEWELYRRDLALKLEIIKRGSLRNSESA